MINTPILRFMRKKGIFNKRCLLRITGDLTFYVVMAAITLFLLFMAITSFCDISHAQGHLEHKYIIIDHVDLDTIAQIESSNNPSAYNKESHATGLYQITPTCLEDFNRFYKDREYKKWGLSQNFGVLNMRDMFDVHLAYIVADWYMNKRIPYILKHYEIEDTVKNRLWAYNAGFHKVKRGIMPLETRNYIKKYFEEKG